MQQNNLIEKYKQVNRSFDEKLIFNFGRSAGFFSEYNNMLFTMLYCLEHKIEFQLYSASSTFGGNGWAQYFDSFCVETKSKFHSIYNVRYYKKTIKFTQFNFFQKLYRRVFMKINGITYMTQDIWAGMRNEAFSNKHYYIPELGIDGDIRQACQVLADITWHYNTETQAEINKLKSSLNLPDKFAGMHIRRGDKGSEAETQELDKYFDAVKEEENKHLFILTDDYDVINEISKLHPQWSLYTLCQINEKGYFYDDLIKTNDEKLIEQYIRFFASIDLLIESYKFIGTFSANPALFIGIRKDLEDCVGIDFHWRVW